MTRYKQTIMAAAMLVLISMPAGLFMLYKVQKVLVKHEMREKLDIGSGLQTVVLHQSQVKWHEVNREIVVNGTLFDVLSQTPVPGTDSISFSGLFDEEETELEYKTGRLIREKEKGDDTQRLIAQSVWIFNSPLQKSASLTAISTETSTIYNPLIVASILLADISVPAPPPKQFPFFPAI